MHQTQPKRKEGHTLTIPAPTQRHKNAPPSQRMAHRNEKRNKTRATKIRHAMGDWN